MAKIYFSDKDDGVYFVYHDTPPKHPKARINPTALFLYGLYRNAVFHSYGQNPDLADDIKKFQPIYDNSKKPASPLYHYSVFACADAMREWTQQKENMKCYIAYRETNGVKQTVGFIHFVEREVNGEPVVYIAQAGAATIGNSIGRRLMECVLSHYPDNTTFYILTRIFNREATNLYQKRFKFDCIPLSEIKQLGYDERYCGFRGTSSLALIEEIDSKKRKHGEGVNQDFSITRPSSSNSH